MDAKEDRKLDKIAAEAQAFLLNNQKKVISDSGSVTSLGKGTVIGGSVEETKSVKSMRKTSGLNDTKSSIATGTMGMSFSKAGQGMKSKLF